MVSLLNIKRKQKAICVCYWYILSPCCPTHDITSYLVKLMHKWIRNIKRLFCILWNFFFLSVRVYIFLISWVNDYSCVYLLYLHFLNQSTFPIFRERCTVCQFSGTVFRVHSAYRVPCGFRSFIDFEKTNYMLKALIFRGFHFIS